MRIPNAGFSAFDVLQHRFWVQQVVIHDCDFDLWIAGDGRRKLTAGEGDNGCDGRVLEALLKDFATDEAGWPGEDDFHPVIPGDKNILINSWVVSGPNEIRWIWTLGVGMGIRSQRMLEEESKGEQAASQGASLMPPIT